jgi:hypothetical protein
MNAAIATNTKTTTHVPALLRNVPINAIVSILKSRKFNLLSVLEKYTFQKRWNIRMGHVNQDLDKVVGQFRTGVTGGLDRDFDVLNAVILRRLDRENEGRIPDHFPGRG